MLNRQLGHNTLHGGFLLLTLLGLGAWPLRAATPAEQQDYSRRAVEAVVEQMERMGESAGGFRFEVVGGPLILPECVPAQAAHNSRPSQEKTDLPRALVLVAVIGSGEHVERLYRVGFGEQVDTHASPYGTPNELWMPLDEWRRLNAELSPFYETALDINRGPERFYPYLPRDMHAYIGPESADLVWLLPREVANQLSDDELRHVAASYLDFVVLLVWLGLQGEPVDPWVESLEPEVEPDGLEGVRRLLARIAQLTAAAKERLRASGCSDPGYRAAATRYLRLLLGEGSMVKAWNEDLIRGLPRWAELYIVGGTFAVVFAKPRGKLEVVSVLVAD